MKNSIVKNIFKEQLFLDDTCNIEVEFLFFDGEFYHFEVIWYNNEDSIDYKNTCNFKIPHFNYTKEKLIKE